MELGFYRPERISSKKQKSYRYLLVLFDKFPKFGWTIPLKKRLKR